MLYVCICTNSLLLYKLPVDGSQGYVKWFLGFVGPIKHVVVEGCEWCTLCSVVSEVKELFTPLILCGG